MDNKGKKILEGITTYFHSNASKDDKLDLWFVLAACRGPDIKDKEEKEATTEVVRRKVFGKTVIPGTKIRTSGDSSEKRTTRGLMSRGHFRWHMHRAFDSLGLRFSNGDAEPSDE